MKASNKYPRGASVHGMCYEMSKNEVGSLERKLKDFTIASSHYENFALQNVHLCLISQLPWVTTKI